MPCTDHQGGTGGQVVVVKPRSKSASNVDRVKRSDNRRWTMLECSSSSSVTADDPGKEPPTCRKGLLLCKENRLSRGLSRIFRRNQQTYHVSKEARRAMSEIALSRIRYDDDDGDQSVLHTEVSRRHVRMHSADQATAAGVVLTEHQVCL